MTYHALTTFEVHQIVGVLRTYEAWQGARTYAQHLYGPCAATLTVDVQFAYDDQGGYFPSIREVSASDSAGKNLTYDFSTPWWQEALETYVDPDTDAMRTFAEVVVYFTSHPEELDYDVTDDLRMELLATPDEQTTWDLRVEPQRPPTLYRDSEETVLASPPSLNDVAGTLATYHGHAAFLEGN